MTFIARIRAQQNPPRVQGAGVVSPPATSPLPAASLADDIIRGLRHLLLNGDFKINTPDAEVFVGRGATVVATPPVMRVTIAHLRRTEPTNRRLWRLAPHHEAPVFNALRQRDWLLAPPRKSVVRATVFGPPGHLPSCDVELTGFNALVIKNDVLWAGSAAPAPFEGRIAFADLRDQTDAFVVADFDHQAQPR